MKRVLVTGATGFIGGQSLRLLSLAGYEVHAVHLHAPHDPPPGVVLHRADLLDTAAVDRLLAEIRPTHLLHFAWYVEPGAYWRSPENFRWLEAGIALLRSFHLCGGRRVVMAGSCAEYHWNDGICTEEMTPCRPATPYGLCKNVLQEVLRGYSEQVGLSSAWGRIFSLYGPNENPRRLVPSVIISLLRAEKALCSHGNQIRDFLHVKDVASAFVALLESDVAGAVNVASGRPVALREVVTTIAGLIGAGSKVEFGAIDAGAHDPPLLVGDNRRLIHEVGWVPEFGLYDGIGDTVEFWRKKLGYPHA